MAELLKMYKESLPEMKFVGRCYKEEDKVNDTYSYLWGEWFDKGLFKPLCLPDGADKVDVTEAFYGLCRCSNTEPFQYWIGVFLPLDFPVPDGYDSFIMPAGDIVTCWVYGKEPDIYMFCSLEEMAKAGYEWKADEHGAAWMMERYVCPRFTEPDEKGNRVLDMCYYIK